MTITVTTIGKDTVNTAQANLAVDIGSSAGTIQVGEPTITPVHDSGNGNLLLAQQVTLAQQGTLQSLSFYIDKVGGQLRLGLYDDSNGTPGSLLAQTNAFTPTAVGWITQATTTTPNCRAGSYWLAYLPQSNTLGFRNSLSGGPLKLKAFTFGSMPAAFPANPSTENSHFSFYATFQVTAMPTVWVVSTAVGGVVPIPPPTTSCPFGTNLGDGCPAGSFGTPQFPTILNNYGSGGIRAANGNQPPWNVAGVDYHVGCPTNITLKNPRTDTLPSGVSRNTTTRVFTVTAANVVIDSWDFSEGGGWIINNNGGGNNLTVTNNNMSFSIARTEDNVITTRNTTGFVFRYNTCDGTNTDGGSHFLLVDSNVIIEYNYFKNISNDIVQPDCRDGSFTAGGQFHFRYNLINQIATDVTASGNHGDVFNPIGAAGTNWNDWLCEYNTAIQNVNIDQSNGFYWIPNAGTTSSPTMQNNTVMTFSSGVCYPGIPTPGACSLPNNVGGVAYSATFNLDNSNGTISGTYTLKNNYVDWIGIGASGGSFKGLWSGGTAYVVGNRVYDFGNDLYTNLINNTGTRPVSDLNSATWRCDGNTGVFDWRSRASPPASIVVSGNIDMVQGTTLT